MCGRGAGNGGGVGAAGLWLCGGHVGVGGIAASLCIADAMLTGAKPTAAAA
eukprot:CAMPEP_0182934032 /NCGR_PEP_ID=MMETSP0105_2-20130417/35303_1 /TAXON_ID=81532 ORGANISM="Acanthoeca-like sp., Strain 10tr" /NCGR_SAMPLE_ID=MMETSP0105_2 /ASSEMBLY_ACC=CAM_ASM_000205 /LENGTH=50 /DNA_ID=CAMNT_0025072839 /DNA_START=325 /DNA_END=477 /DNA_ORIENTATION=-